MGKGGGDKVTVGYRYYMSLHMGLCRGPVDEIVQINVGDIRAWPIADGNSEIASGLMAIAEGPDPNKGIGIYETGDYTEHPASEINTVRTTATTNIAAGEIFGGDKKEGGVAGTLNVLMGRSNQVVPSWIKSMMGSLVPDFRGVATLFFDGLLCSLNPYPKKWAVRVRRTVSGWDGAVWQPSLATIWMKNGTIKAMNPAHIVYQCLTDRSWGRGYPREWLNDEAFLEVARILYNEGFGLCLRWNRQSSIGEFVQEVIDHVGGSLYVDRSLGLVSMSLLRGDYDAEAIPHFTYDSGLLSVEEGEVMSQEDIVNEAIVGWKDPVENLERQVRVHNLASIQTLGGTNSSTSEYRGIPTAELGLRVAQRDLKAGATSLRRFKVQLDRRAWRLVPGEVFRISAPDKDIHNVVLRAGKVEDAGMVDGKITVECVLDVFSMPSRSFGATQQTSWSPPDRTPKPAERRYVREITYGELIRVTSRGLLGGDQSFDSDAGTIITLASKPTYLSQGYEVATRTGSGSFRSDGSGDFAPSATLSSSIAPNQKNVECQGFLEPGLIEVGMSVQIGDEIARLDSIDTSTGLIEIARGCVDTVPQSHPAGRALIFFDDQVGSDERDYVKGEIVDVKLLTNTSSGVLEKSRAPTDSVEIVARHDRSWAPGNVRVNGYLANGTAVSAEAPASSEQTITWSHRNRLVIKDQLIASLDASTSAEPDILYDIRVYSSPDSYDPVRTVTIIGDSGLQSAREWTYTSEMAQDDNMGSTVTFELRAKRNGRYSFAKHRFTVDRE